MARAKPLPPSLGRRRRLAAPQRLVCALLVGLSARAVAQSGPPAPRPDEQFDFMNLLTAHGLHDIVDESWNAYGQFTFISSSKLPFSAKYTNLNGSNNSLSPDTEWGFTGTATLYLGVRLWPGAEAYLVPELISERPLSGLHGLGGAIQNFELQKNGSEAPGLYRSRAYLRQTIELGGEPRVKASDPLQLGAVYRSRRLVFEAGNFSVLDFFDKNSVLGDLRSTFFSLGFLTYAAWDFNSDARGYSFGGVVEIYWDDWSLRFARITPPPQPNVLPVDFRLDQVYGDQLEIEHDHQLFGLDGAVRLLGYRNRDRMGRFADAIAAFQANPAQNNAANCGPGRFNYGSTNARAPDLCFVRGPNVKLGIGLSVEQHVTSDVGVFLRAMVSDGDSEVDAYTSADRSLSLGITGKGTWWTRPKDVAGIGLNVGWISQSHADYLKLGGVDAFIGDGAITPAAETSSEIFYSVNLWSSLWLSGDYQLIVNPGYNSDRGPVHVLGARIHVEF